MLGVILGDARGTAQVNAQVGSGDGWGGEIAVIRLKGEVVKHAESVVLPLLLPDSPVAIWWPTTAPADPATDPLGDLAQRRITDSAGVTRGKSTAMLAQCRAYAPGNTDLSWTRLTPWRALLAAALDQHPLKVTGAASPPSGSAPAPTCSSPGWPTGSRSRSSARNSDGPGITEVTMDTKEGPIPISRADGRLATFTSPNRPDRPVALKRREMPALLSEELRRLDEDDVYAATTAKRGRAPRKDAT